MLVYIVTRSPDLMPTDYPLWGNMKKWPTGKIEDKTTAVKEGIH
jgi:hypothetical protein